MSASFNVILLGLVSAFTLALANFAVKRKGDVLTARMVLSCAMALCVLPFAFFVPPVPAALWPHMIGAVAVHWLYQFAMVRALHRGDLSMVFPVMRGLAPLVTAVLAFALLGERLDPLAIVGVVLASLAIIAFTMPADRLSRLTDHPDLGALGWAVATSCGVALYSVVDAAVARQTADPATFIVWLFLLDWIGITLVNAWVHRRDFWRRTRPQLKGAGLGGVAGTVSYGAAVYAFTLTDTTALVTALRETAVVFAALLGVMFLREGLGPQRIGAAAMLATGLVLMQF